MSLRESTQQHSDSEGSDCKRSAAQGEEPVHAGKCTVQVQADTVLASERGQAAVGVQLLLGEVLATVYHWLHGARQRMAGLTELASCTGVMPDGVPAK